VIFVSRFLPMFRAVVPIFAGTSGVGFWRAAIPMALASAAWYGAIVYLGATAGRKNWQEIRSTVEASGKWLAVAAGVLALAVGWWWWKSRREAPSAGRVVSPRAAPPAEPGTEAAARRFLVEPFLDHLRFERGLAGNTLDAYRTTWCGWPPSRARRGAARRARSPRRTCARC
jgi:hypothetical protein